MRHPPRKHPIVHRFWLRDGIPNWKVRIPSDLRSKDPKDRKTANFRDEKMALLFAKSLNQARTSLSSLFLKKTPIEQTEALKFLEEKEKQSRLTVEQAAQQCRDAKRAAGRRENSLSASDCAFRSMVKAFGGKPIQSVATADLNQWLDSQVKWSLKTRLNNIKYAASLFSWCIKQDFLVRNPCAGVERPKVPFKPPGILSLPQIRQLLGACRQHDPALIGYISLTLFGGFRVAESARCVAADISGETITLTGERTKLNLPRRIKISPQLAAWLAIPGADIGGRRLNRRLNALAKLAGVTLTRNCLRHCFCSYSYPVLGVIATARAANNSEAMLAKHYLNAVTDEDAKAFAEILPQ